MSNRRTPFADAHAHVAEQGFSDRYPDAADAAIFFGCTARPDEWERMRACDVRGTVRFYGVHPWYADQWDESTASRLRGMLEEDGNAHVGEIGLDSKRGDIAPQIHVLEEQLDIASEFGRMVNIHMVGCERDVLESLRRHGRGCGPMILHSFSSESYVKPFADIGCMFSINPRVTARSDERLGRLLSSIPGDRLLLETDAPYVPRGFAGMRPFAERIGEVMGMSGNELITMTLDNVRRIAHG